MELYSISGTPPTIAHQTTLQFFPENVLITAFNWHPDGTTLGMTLSDGQLCLGCSDLPQKSSEAPIQHRILQHDLEAWTLAFLPDGSGILSGGDDCTLRFLEVPQDLGKHVENPDQEAVYGAVRRMPWTDIKIHGAGVTAILPIQIDGSSILVITGSYDDHIRLIHIPAMGRRQVLAEENLGGGVWRFKVLDTHLINGKLDEMVLLVSCMYAGARIVKVRKGGEEWNFEILAKFEEHESMNYGCDAQPDIDEEGRRTIVSTSFYDRLVCLWKY